MKLLEERILSDGKVLPGGILKVDNFLNHQIDTALLWEMAQEFHRLFGGEGVNKILTIEARRKTSPTASGPPRSNPSRTATKTPCWCRRITCIRATAC